MRLIINGEQRDVPAQLDIQSLIHHLGLALERVAVERNREVVRRDDWRQTQLEENDRIEIIHFVGGGMR